MEETVPSCLSSPGLFPLRISQCCISNLCELRVPSRGVRGHHGKRLQVDRPLRARGQRSSGLDGFSGNPLLLLLVGRLRPRWYTACLRSHHTEVHPGGQLMTPRLSQVLLS